MKQLMLSDEILLSVEKPARYIGDEFNSVKKNLDNIDIRFALCFPDLYEIGMSNVGLSILYNFLNCREDTYCERVFSPWVDLEEHMRKENIPLFSLESQDPINKFDFIGFTLQYEMIYTNIINSLDLANIPVYSRDRSENDPIICAGGPCAYNPEPIAEFIDFFYIGEGESNLSQVLDIYKKYKQKNNSKDEFLKEIATIEGIYVPKFYDVEYNEDGTIKSFTPNCSEAKEKINKQLVMNVTDVPYPTKPIVPYIQTVHDRVVLELFRGCIRGCRFCQAGMIYRPVRLKDVEKLKEQAAQLLKNTGHDEISLISLSSSDYDYLYELAQHLIDTYGKENHINISLPSLRIDSFSLELMSKVQDVRKSSLTFAPEGGSQRLRDVMNKGISEEDILNGCKQAFEGGWNRVKLYFMLGLPTETLDDVKAIATLGQDIVEKYYELPKEKRRTKVQVVVSTSFFVPKPFSPFQWVAQNTVEEFMAKQDLLNKNINKKNIKYNCHDAYLSVLEGVMARGDRKIGQVIKKAHELGARFDAWSEHFDNDIWTKAFEECNIDPMFYTARERKKDEILPWDFINIGVEKDFLYNEYEKAKAAKITPNCKLGCSSCGSNIFTGGLCDESKN